MASTKDGTGRDWVVIGMKDDPFKRLDDLLSLFQGPPPIGLSLEESLDFLQKALYGFWAVNLVQEPEKGESPFEPAPETCDPFFELNSFYKTEHLFDPAGPLWKLVLEYYNSGRRFFDEKIRPAWEKAEKEQKKASVFQRFSGRSVTLDFVPVGNNIRPQGFIITNPKERALEIFIGLWLEALPRIRKCPICGKIFVDLTKPGVKVYCTRKCFMKKRYQDKVAKDKAQKRSQESISESEAQ